MHELRLAIRRLTTRPTTTGASILSLAFGIAAAAVTWAIVIAVLLKPLPVAEPDRLVLVEVTYEGPGGSPTTTSHQYPLFEQVRDGAIFAETVAGGTWPLLVGANGAPPVSTPVYFASASFFSTLGVPIPLGRGFEPADDRAGAPLVVVLSERFWRRVYSADPGAIGRTLALGDQIATIIGVSPKGFRGLDLATSPQLFVPLQNAGAVINPVSNIYARPDHQSSPSAWLTIVGRLEPGTSTASVDAHLNTLPPLPRMGQGRFTVIHAATAALPAAARAGVRQFTRLLAGTVVMLVLVGCASLAMLLLIRTEARRTEFATCLALGASRRRLALGIALEGAMSAVLGAVLSTPISTGLLSAVSAFQLPGGVNLELLELSLNGAVVSAAAAVAIVVSLIVAAVAATMGFSGSVAESLRARSGSTAPILARFRHRVLVSAQVAVAVVLLAGAGLFARSLGKALELNTGFETFRLLSSTVAPAGTSVSLVRADQFFDELLTRLRANHAFSAVATSAFTSSMGRQGTLVIDGERRQFPSEVAFTSVDLEYFATIGLASVEGRVFAREDTPTAARVAVVSASFGRLIGNGETPLGRRITMPFSRSGQPADVITVVGVVPDLVSNVSVLQPLTIYMPNAQTGPSTRRTVTVKAAGDVEVARRELAATIRQIDSQATYPAFLSLEDRLWNQMGPQRFGAFVLGVLASLAVLLTLGAIYVLAESLTVLRMREMGIRAALGATGRQLSGLVLRETTLLVGVGLVGGLILAWASTETIRSFLYHVQPFDGITLSSVAALILLLALSVSLRPALRAARVDLASVLRAE
jgi:putative ABC transport system permease protein